MITFKRLFFIIHLLFILIIAFAGFLMVMLGFNSLSSLPFVLFLCFSTLLLSILGTFDILILLHNDLLLPFVERDPAALYRALEHRIFNRLQFSSFFISYYLLLCTKLGYSWKLKELETLVQAKKMSSYPKLAHFFSLQYLANGNLEECRSWYPAVLQYKTVKRKNDIHFDYAFKLIGLNEGAAALEEMQKLLQKKTDPFLTLLIVYLVLIILEKLPSDSPYIISMSQNLMQKQKILARQKAYLKKMITNSNNYKVDIHFILLENIAKEAMGWLESWTAQK